MNEFNLKKKQYRTKAYQKKDNILSRTGFELIKNKVDFINKDFQRSLFIDDINDFKIKKLNKIDFCDFEKINKNNNRYDSIFSNFNTQLNFANNLDECLKSVYKRLENDGLFCFNILTPNSMKTIRKIFIEIDEGIFKGAFNRFGPFHDISSIIENLNYNKFKEIVVGTEFIELNYRSFDRIRDDFKEFGISNYSKNVPKFKKDFLIKTYSVFSKIIAKYKYIPVEYEIATFTSWK
mgnify:CR=1 FL=1|tara:strand:+ start:107 stop:814 length:708 start_codon:yes stop_codon:yes gene_type:complete